MPLGKNISNNSQLVSGARRDYQSSKYSGNPSMKKEPTEISDEQKPGVIMTPEVVKALGEKKQELIQTRRDLEKQRRMDEYDQRARARQMRVQDTLEKTGLDRY